MRLFLLLFSLLISFTSGATLTDVDKTTVFSKNHLLNGGFESGKQYWTASAGTFSTTNAVNALIGRMSVTWDAAASGNTLSSNLVNIINGDYGRNGIATCLISVASGTATHEIQVYDGTNVLAEVSVFSNTTPVRTSLNYVIPTSGALSLRLYANADEPDIKIDDCYLGPAEGYNLGLTNPQDIFSAQISSADVVSAENADFISGDCTDATTGEQTCTFVSGFFTATPNCQATVSDATDGRIASITAVSSSAITITTTDDAGAATNLATHLSCQKTGADALQQIVRPDLTAQSWSGYHDNTCSWANSGAAFDDPTADASCALVERTNTNFGTVSTYGSALPGITFTPKRIGKYYVCGKIVGYPAAGNTVTMRLWDGTTVVAESMHTNATAYRHTHKMCGIYSATSTSSVSLRIQQYTDSSGVTMEAGVASAAAEWEIIALENQFPAPLLVNSVVNPRTTVTNICSGYVTNAGAPTMTRSDGNCASVASDNGTGDTTLSFAANTFTGTPNCTCTADVAAAVHICLMDAGTAVSSTTVRFQTANDAGTGADNNFAFICIGPK